MAPFSEDFHPYVLRRNSGRNKIKQLARTNDQFRSFPSQVARYQHVVHHWDAQQTGNTLCAFVMDAYRQYRLMGVGWRWHSARVLKEYRPEKCTRSMGIECHIVEN
jgi:hypothetical protein